MTPEETEWVENEWKELLNSILIEQDPCIHDSYNNWGMGVVCCKHCSKLGRLSNGDIIWEEKKSAT